MTQRMRKRNGGDVVKYRAVHGIKTRLLLDGVNYQAMMSSKCSDKTKR